MSFADQVKFDDRGLAVAIAQDAANGEVLMGALWKVRSRLKASLGNAAGIALADTLLNGWMNAYDDSQIRTIIEVHWLTLDDDDANIDNGTPHFADIDGGFTDQGFPGYVLPDVVIANVTQLPDTQDETGPYTVTADITAALAPPIASATLHRRINGGPWLMLPAQDGLLDAKEEALSSTVQASGQLGAPKLDQRPLTVLLRVEDAAGNEASASATSGEVPAASSPASARSARARSINALPRLYSMTARWFLVDGEARSYSRSASS